MKHTPGPCECRIYGPVGIGAVLSDESLTRIVQDGQVYGIQHCPLHKAAPKLLAALEQLADACEGFLDPNGRLHVARAAIAKAKGEA